MSTTQQEKQAGSKFVVCLFFICLGFELLFVLLDLTVNWWKYSDSPAIRRMFNITREDGIASLFAVIQTLALGGSCWIIFCLTRRAKNKTARENYGWLVLALFFTYMGVDDGAMIHERLGTAFKHSVEEGSLPTYGWQIILAPVFVLFGVFVLVFLWTRSRLLTDRLLLLAGLGCLGLAVLIDLVEGSPHGHRILADLVGSSENTFSHFSKSFEEFIEMLGITFLWVLVVRYLFVLMTSVIIICDKGKLKIESV